VSDYGATENGTPAIRLEGISKRLGRTWALREISLEVERGTSLVIIGPNGAGKTTLLRVIATLLRPSAGAGEVLGLPLVRGADGIRRRLGLLSTRGHLYDDLTALENLRFAAWMAGLRARDERFRSILASVGLSSDGERRVREFSSGMRKRLVFGTLLTRRLDMVLLDEPYASLDGDGVRMVDGFLDGWKRAGRTVLLATHRRGLAVRAADRVVVLRAGRLLRYCRPSELEPADLDPSGDGGTAE
jgi:ABC-type multidrug transport system ATPase subunit